MTRPLDALVSAGYLRYERDPLWERRPVITLADPIVRFHNLITVGQHDLVETGRSAQAWQAVQPTFTSRILGPHFEECARDWVRHADDSVLRTYRSQGRLPPPDDDSVPDRPRWRVSTFEA